MSDLAKLSRLLSQPDSLLLELEGRDAYFHDATDLTVRPAGIFIPQTKADLVTAVRFCREHKILITPRGAGTGLSGGCVPASSNSLVISTEALNNLTVIPDNMMAFCGPGVITKTLVDEAARHGLAYPPDPASWAESTIGGNVAEGAGGLRCKRFGVTKDYVIGLEAVTVDGQLLKTGVYAGNSGFLLGDVLISSEGTLAIITEVAVRLVPSFGRGITILVAFNRPKDAGQTVSDITTAGIIPNVLEFLDGEAAACSNQYEKTEGLDDCAALLLIETSDIESAGQAEQIRQICKENHASYLRVESDHEQAEHLWKVRRNLSKAVKQIATIRVSEDVAVPNTKFAALVDFVAEMRAEGKLRINSFGHAGDGNLHVNFLSMTGSQEDQELIEQYTGRLMRKTLEMGGTLTGEHGIGLAKRQFLAWEFDPPTLRAMQRLKDVFDPQHLLNPDKLLPGQI